MLNTEKFFLPALNKDAQSSANYVQKKQQKSQGGSERSSSQLNRTAESEIAVDWPFHVRISNFFREIKIGILIQYRKPSLDLCASIQFFFEN
jgi:hypothetical protein